MTINKSQDQSLKHVGVYLSSHIFSHDLKILISDDDGEDTDVMSNVVYHDVFRNVS
ncbi:PIF1 helicase, putative [Medicago truncatula]|uniref:PIF1 helicase, putative n=1 Tax=Medicago truncatula TaxID=3880 RepID=G7I514_MEDTR|nr:PIF1 helicase, putative [Medicago truncatula]